MFSHFFLENRTVYEIMSKQCSGDRGATNDVTIWCIHVACWISKVICTCAHAHAHAFGYPHARTRKHAHTYQYVILIAFPQQQLLRYTYIARLVPLRLIHVPESVLTTGAVGMVTRLWLNSPCLFRFLARVRYCSFLFFQNL